MTPVSQGKDEAATPRRRVTAGIIALAGLVPFAVWFTLADHSRLTDPLTFVLAGGALAANLLEVRVEGSLWLSASFICCMIAAAFLGPAPASTVALFAEVGAWLYVRFDPVALACNAFGAVAPTAIAAGLIGAIAPSPSRGDLVFDGAIALAATVALALNLLIVPMLMALRDGLSLFRNLSAAFLHFLPVHAVNIALVLLVVHAYRQVGLGASAFVIAVVLLFTYVVRLLVTTRKRASRIAELSASRGRLVAQALDAEDRERRILAEHLHDEAIQNLLAARQDLEEAQDGERGDLARARAAIEVTVAQLRAAVFDLHPAVLEHAGLAAAIKAITEKHSTWAGFHAHVQIDSDASGGDDQLFFSLCRELVSNVAKHARATEVSIRLKRAGNHVELEVKDDGIGFDETRRAAAVAEGHVGLASITERVQALSGEVEVEARVGSGTRVRVRLYDERSPDVTPVARDASLQPLQPLDPKRRASRTGSQDAS